MAIYGNFNMYTIDNINEKVETEESLLSFISESSLEMELIFERVNIISILQEENTSLTIPSTINFKSEPEEIKKTIIEKIKEIIQRVKQFIVKTFEKVTGFLQKKYLETNLTDKFFSQFKDVITFDNLTKARQNGWMGLPIEMASITRIADLTDSSLYAYHNDEVLINMSKDVEPIIQSNNLEDARDKYAKFKEKLKKFKSEQRFESTLYYQYDAEMRFEYTGNEKYLLFGITRDRSDNKHYYPNQVMFNNAKSLTESGQKQIKSSKFFANAMIKGLKIDSTITFSNMKSFKGNGSNVSGNKEIDTINMLYYKAKYESQIAIIERYLSIVKALSLLVKNQRSVAINNYLLYFAAIKRYVKIEAK